MEKERKEMEKERKEIRPDRIDENFIELIGKEWMLVAAGDREKMNMMTASWGGVGVLWNRPVVFVFIRPERYTLEFVEARKAFTLSFLGKQHREAYALCGSRSGRDIDKVEATGLTPFFTADGNPGFEEARLTLECKTLAVSEMKAQEFLDVEIYDRWYNATQGNPHRIYVAEIVRAWEK